ncbi:hypothetical protein ACFO0J_06880 [Castellaniella hirudinis]|uniref:Fido domain-containing protein n=1 Tax=Castellaniella hirudinis TaxID=1144617 RepID=A0ABV8RX21_9BURK
MNGITLRQFESLAGQNQSGVITLDKSNQDLLINNKGTLGRAIVSAFKDIGQALGWGDSTRAQRQSEALEVFQKLLESRYGKAATAQAMQQAGLQGASQLNARDVDRVIQLAARGRHENLLDQAARLSKYEPPIAGSDPSEAFQRILSSFKPPVVLSSLSDQVCREYTQRLSEGCKGISNLGVKPLSEEKMFALGRETLKHVLGMEARGQLDDARAVRDSLRQGWKDLLLAIGQGATPQDIMNCLDVIQQRTSLLLRYETGPDEDIGSDFFQECAGTALLGALNEMRGEQAPLVRSLLDRALDDQGALKSIYLAVQDGLSAFDEHGSLTNLQFAGRLQRDIGTLVSVLTSAMGSRGGSDDDNIDRLGAETLKGSLRQEGVQMFEQARQRQFDPQRDLIQGYLSRYDDPDTDEDLPLWYKTEALVQLEQDVLAQAESLQRSPREILSDLRVALDTFEDMLPEFKARIVAAFDAIEAGLTMHERLDDHPVFGVLAPQDHWRLFTPGNLQDLPGAGKWTLEQYGQGSLAAMQRAFLGMIDDLRDGAPLDDRWLDRIQQTGSKNTFRNEDLSNTYKTSFKAMDEDGSEAISLLEESRVPSGYRNGDTNLNLRQDTQLTPAGRDELRALLQSDPWFKSINETDTGFDISFTSRTDQECRDRARDILARHEQDMTRALTDEDRIAVIARTTQALYRSHLFMDGNTRTTVFVAMNGLLLKAGLSPCILPEPKAAAGFSSDEFAQEIIRGQQVFQALSDNQDSL